MIIAFILTMTNRGSWNGRWSGESNLYCVVKNFGRTQKAEARAKRIEGSYYYAWTDGWGANVEAKIVEPVEARKLRKRSQGFCGYEWMIESILMHGKILADHQIPETEKKG